MARTEERQWTSATTGGDGEDLVATVSMADTTQLFYFAGRPVAQVTTGPELLYLTTDHLGTPSLATDNSGAAVWAGGVEPFGATWTAGPDNPDPEPATSGSLRSASEAAIGRLSSERIFLRYPGQWGDPSFQSHGLRGGLYYNVHRWYDSSTGRYSQPDPAFRAIQPSYFEYGSSNPVTRIDPLGLLVYDVTGPYYHYLDWTQVVQRCDGSFAHGCTRAPGQADCACVPDGDCWKPRIVIRARVDVFIATNSWEAPADIVLHENRHVVDYLTVLFLLGTTGHTLEGQRFNQKLSCEASCLAFENMARGLFFAFSLRP